MRPLTALTLITNKAVRKRLNEYSVLGARRSDLKRYGLNSYVPLSSLTMRLSLLGLRGRRGGGQTRNVCSSVAKNTTSEQRKKPAAARLITELETVRHRGAWGSLNN